MDFSQLSEPISSDFKSMNETILCELSSEVPLIEQIGQHLINSGGKRIRPLITLLASRAAGYEGSQHIKVAALIEFFHTSTLLHDDVVDQSQRRRGRATANAIWGNSASVLVGDFLLSKAFQIAVSIRNIKLLDVLAEATRIIAEGEVMQLSNCKNADTSEADYTTTIKYKTAKLFQAAAQTGAIVSNALESVESGLSIYGSHLGCAFQLIDDMLDYTGSEQALGKNIGDDLSEGKPTLPLIYTLANGSEAEKNLIRNSITKGCTKNINSVIEAINRCGALKYTFQRAEEETSQAIAALDTLENSIYKSTLIELAEASLDRCS